MKRTSLLKNSFVALALGASLIACKKQEAPPAQSQADTTAPAPATSPDSAPTVAPAPAANAQAALSDVNAAMKAKEYDRAVKSMLAVQTAKLTDQQAMEAHNRMIQLQKDLASAVANGDPKAKAAADMLRASATVH